MINPLGELDEAELRVELRKLYTDVGYPGCIQALYELLKTAQILNDIIIEETQNEERKKI